MWSSLQLLLWEVPSKELGFETDSLDCGLLGSRVKSRNETLITLLPLPSTLPIEASDAVWSELLTAPLQK